MSQLKLENLGYKYSKITPYVFQDLNLEFEKGKIYAIVGKSGAGKTTLLSLLSGLDNPTEGKIGPRCATSARGGSSNRQPRGIGR
jgi:putative ABC transport system ATP-binding protein